MKTARIPNCPRLSRFLELNGDSAAVQAEIDVWHQTELVLKLTDAQYHYAGEMAVLLTPEGEEPDHNLVWELNEAFHNAVRDAAEATATHINMMERKIGLTAQDSPSELVKQAISIYTDTQSKIIEAMWSNV
jgi:hypothetical protein